MGGLHFSEQKWRRNRLGVKAEEIEGRLGRVEEVTTSVGMLKEKKKEKQREGWRDGRREEVRKKGREERRQKLYFL